ncbi:hypothetical protein [Deefgea sp. CFH1-16]|uniref:hypothetical protein n=1 Tax=Deefgea sp. CFH1-16 TaxID=2675457 RepID=UPI0015F6458B|nr:hypothetical protein [Deefgea sp. CFH1-16]
MRHWFFYIVYNDGQENAYHETIGDPEIVPFVTEQQRHRKADDLVPLSTPALTFEHNKDLHQLPIEQVGKITPSPLSSEWLNGEI